MLLLLFRVFPRLLVVVVVVVMIVRRPVLAIVVVVSCFQYGSPNVDDKIVLLSCDAVAERSYSSLYYSYSLSSTTKRRRMTTRIMLRLLLLLLRVCGVDRERDGHKRFAIAHSPLLTSVRLACASRYPGSATGPGTSPPRTTDADRNTEYTPRSRT